MRENKRNVRKCLVVTFGLTCFVVGNNAEQNTNTMSYNLVYIVNSTVRETLQYNIHNRTLGNWLLNQAKATNNYNMGLLQLRTNK